jgi:hypothetical protein
MGSRAASEIKDELVEEIDRKFQFDLPLANAVKSLPEYPSIIFANNFNSSTLNGLFCFCKRLETNEILVLKSGNVT